MSTKRSAAQRKRPRPVKRLPAPARRQGRVPFAVRLRGTIALLLVLCVALTAANIVSEPRPNAVSALEGTAGTAGFELYTLERDVSYDNAGKKNPDTIRGTHIADSGDGTVILTAPPNPGIRRAPHRPRRRHDQRRQHQLP